ncbi:hypothetical protein WUBG_13411 [Wuchereria bancrofti]|uniref:Uncharacterized protein n=1 Tax=Wuchereria bancrofti TaxID=6293 RepID=J9AN23_WUCBA|nr:hypothetical protein WUBG_13411 [Wuchereria bancrofti]
MKKKMRTGKTINNIINSDRMISLDTTIGCLSLLNSIKLIVIIGLLSTLAISILIIMYFRPAILAIIIPITVISTTLYGILRRKHFCLWPIIGISKIENIAEQLRYDRFTENKWETINPIDNYDIK